MSSSNPSACVNCNIQGSTSTYLNQNAGANIIHINPPPKRYNPAVANPVSAGSDTSGVVSKVINVSAQSGFSGGEATGVSKTSQKTQNILANILNVSSDIVQADTTKQKIAKNETRSQQVDDDKKESAKVIINVGRIRRKVAVADTSEDKSDKKVVKKHKLYRTAGTLLASSPEFQAKFNSLIREKPKLLMKEKEETKIDIVPLSFDGRQVWKQFIQPIRSQGLCGSCWAFSSLFCFATRLSIYSKGKYNYIFSPAKLVYCSVSIAETSETEINSIKKMLNDGKRYDYYYKENGKSDNSYGCSGETLINTWQFLFRTGVPEDSCLNYGDEENPANLKFNLTIHEDISLTCSDLTGDSYDICPSSKKRMISHRVGGYYFVPGVKNADITKSGSEYNIRKEIFKFGPCTSGMMVYEDFVNFQGDGIYEYDKKSEKVGGHAIVIIGWGEKGGKKYWIVRNSWGEEWGDNGYFKILRGSNHCEIEENCFVGFPDVPGIRFKLDYPILFQTEDYISKYLYNIRDSGYKNSIYEQLALGKIKTKEIEIKNLYDTSAFPNFDNFYAGLTKTNENMSKETYEKDEYLFEEEDIYKNEVNLIYFKYFIIFILFVILFFFDFKK